MKRLGLITLFLVFVTVHQPAKAQPVFFQQAASVVKSRQLETGVGGQFGYQKYEVSGLAGITFKDTVWHFPAYARYGVLDNLETHLTAPLTNAVKKTEGTLNSRNENTGVGNVQIGAKWNFLREKLPVAVGADFDLPTANTARNVAALGWRYSGQVQQGFNTHGYLALDTPTLGDCVTGHAAVGYLYTGEYTTSSRSKFNPSELMTFAAGVGLKLDRWVPRLSVSSEFVGNTGLNKSKTNGVQNGASEGTVLEAGPAVRYQIGPVRTHAGVLFDKGKADFRAYNYRVLFGVSYLIGGE